jgi:hypothetical protein
MYFKSGLLITGLLVATGAAAADVISQPVKAADSSSKPEPARRVLAPSVHVMRATRQADGSLAMDCVQRPNPLLIKPGTPNSPHRNGGEP